MSQSASQITKHKVYCYHHKSCSKSHSCVLESKKSIQSPSYCWVTIFYKNGVFQTGRQYGDCQILKFLYKIIIHKLLILNFIGFFGTKGGQNKRGILKKTAFKKELYESIFRFSNIVPCYCPSG